jgi:hypothetical protein
MTKDNINPKQFLPKATANKKEYSLNLFGDE